MADTLSRTYDGAVGILTKAVTQGWSVQPAFRESVELAAKTRPSPVWKKILKCASDPKCSPERDIELLVRWLRRCAHEEPPPAVKGFWFGLFDSVGPGMQPYVCGSFRQARLESNNWAVGPEWWPELRYFPSPFIRKLSVLRPKRDDDTKWIIETCIIHSYWASAVVEAVRRIDPIELLGKSKKRAVASGFDSGDSLLLGHITLHGFEASKRLM